MRPGLCTHSTDCSLTWPGPTHVALPSCLRLAHSYPSTTSLNPLPHPASQWMKGRASQRESGQWQFAGLRTVTQPPSSTEPAALQSYGEQTGQRQKCSTALFPISRQYLPPFSAQLTDLVSHHTLLELVLRAPGCLTGTPLQGCNLQNLLCKR